MGAAIIGLSGLSTPAVKVEVDLGTQAFETDTTLSPPELVAVVFWTLMVAGIAIIRYGRRVAVVRIETCGGGSIGVPDTCLCVVCTPFVATSLCARRVCLVGRAPVASVAAMMFRVVLDRFGWRRQGYWATVPEPVLLLLPMNVTVFVRVLPTRSATSDAPLGEPSPVDVFAVGGRSWSFCRAQAETRSEAAPEPAQGFEESAEQVKAAERKPAVQWDVAATLLKFARCGHA